MADDILVIKRLGALWPVDPRGEEVLNSLPSGKVIKATLKRPRSVQHHRLYWALVNKVWENQEIYESPEVLSDVLKVATGHYVMVHDRNGEPYFRMPKSIAFSKMDQAEFNRFFDKVVQVVQTLIIPGLDDQALRAELEEMLKIEDAA